MQDFSILHSQFYILNYQNLWLNHMKPPALTSKPDMK